MTAKARHRRPCSPDVRQRSLGAAINGLRPWHDRGDAAPPLAVMPGERVPVLGMLRRYRAIVNDPTGTAERCRERHDGPFTLRIPFFFDLTYLPGRAGMRLLSDLDPEIARMGPVMKRVPTVGYWFTRSDDGEAHLQALLIAARRFMGDRLRADRLAEVPRVVDEVMAAHTSRWIGQRVDLADVVVRAIYEASLRCMIGDRLTARLIGEVGPLLRTIANGIDIPRTTRSTLPLSRWSPECRATRKLERALRRVVAEHDETGRFPFIDALRGVDLDGSSLPEADVPWLLMYVMWNAVTYPGSYGLWSYLDIASRPEVLGRARARVDHRPLERCFLETVRLHPVSSLVRETTAPVHFQHEGTHYEIPPGGYIGTNTWALNRDPKKHRDPDAYLPLRYERGEPLPHAFGRGAFGCVAGKYSKLLISRVLGHLVDHLELSLDEPLPARRCRVHLTYPRGPIFAHVAGRAPATSADTRTHGDPDSGHALHETGDSAPEGCPFHPIA